jgi:hypothetical protein
MLDASGPAKEIKPILPKEIDDAKSATVHPKMIEAANNLIIKEWNGYSAHFKLKELVAEFVKICGEETTETRVYKEQNLNIEDIFRKAGWKVNYDSPGYNENYDAYFEFSKKKKS